MHEAPEDDPATPTGDSLDRRLGAAWCWLTLNALRDTFSGPRPLSPCRDVATGLSQPPATSAERTSQTATFVNFGTLGPARACSASSRYTSLPDADLQQECSASWVPVDSMHQAD